jgi:choline-sulfatase
VPLPEEDQWDDHSRRLYEAMGLDKDSLTDEEINRARHGYYAMLSYVDDQIGKVLAALEDSGQASDTVVIVTADHGSMLGERGLWGILNFHEWAMRVPFILHAPERFAPRRVSANVSLVDLLPTLVDIASDGQPPELATPVEGSSLIPLADGTAATRDDAVYAEVSAEGSTSPSVMIKRGHCKFIKNLEDPPQLFDLERDPDELTNLAPDPEYAALLRAFEEEAAQKWDLAGWQRDLETSRKRRILIHETYEQGNAPVWDYAVNNDPWRFYQRSFREPWQLTEKKTTLN